MGGTPGEEALDVTFRALGFWRSGAPIPSIIITPG